MYVPNQTNELRSKYETLCSLLLQDTDVDYGTVAIYIHIFCVFFSDSLCH